MSNLTADRKQFLADIFTTALEGGISYWSSCSTYHWSKGDGSSDLDGFYAAITDEEDGTDYRIDRQVIQRGVGLFVRYCNGEINSNGGPGDGQRLPSDHYWRQFLAANRTNGDDGDYDADVADNIVQFGLFGKVVYG
jgi:hypothetical protein